MSDERTMAQILGDCLSDNLAAMQAAWLEWKHGAGAEAAMVWIENTLDGPGLLPCDASAEDLAWTQGNASWAENAQLWFAANRSKPFPTCPCGRPSSSMSLGVGWCSPEHEQLARTQDPRDRSVAS